MRLFQTEIGILQGTQRTMVTTMFGVTKMDTKMEKILMTTLDVEETKDQLAKSNCAR